jgi:hypothetical protein
VTGALPPGWPVGVHPPGTDGFQRSAVGWLYDHCPPDLRADAVLRRHPVALARLAAACQRSAEQALRAELRTVRSELTDTLGLAAVTELVELYAREADRAATAARAAALLEQALGGRRWVPRL